VSSSTLLKVRGLYAGYDGVAVVRNLDLDVAAGEIVALLGPNGAGKTTTLSTIAGLLAPISGEVIVLGSERRGTGAHRMARRGLAFVPEDRSLFASLTVRENLRLGSRQRGAALERAIDFFPALAPLMERKAGLLSGGEQQMLTLGRAIASQPRLLLIDELSLGLAPIIVEGLLDALRRIVAETGCGIVLVEQHVDLALATADRAYVVAHGDAVASGAADELVKNRELLTSSYLGGSVLT
jgi:branched-chain amino acid transport system ATP-binding protein